MNGYNYLILKEFYDKYRRDNRKQTKADVVKGIGISLSSLDNYLQGVSIPSAEVLYKFAVFFGVRVDAFYNYNTKSPKEYDTNTIQKDFVLSENKELYGKDSEGWKKAFEVQQELTEAKVEIERLKKESAIGSTAQTG